jgi:hypothetical protein
MAGKNGGKMAGTWRWSALTPCLQSDIKINILCINGEENRDRSWSAPFPGSGNTRKIR